LPKVAAFATHEFVFGSVVRNPAIQAFIVARDAAGNQFRSMRDG
jgi:hypothetical protein